MPAEFARDLDDFNILIKAHYFTYTKPRYSMQRELLRYWGDAPNVYIAPAEDYSLLPYLATAKVLVSDASTTLFEAAALDIPIVWCDFVKLRWTYRGPFRHRLAERLTEFAQMFPIHPAYVETFEQVYVAEKRRAQDCAVLWVSHDDAQARRVATRHVELRDGRLVDLSKHGATS